MSGDKAGVGGTVQSAGSQVSLEPYFERLALLFKGLGPCSQKAAGSQQVSLSKNE